MAAFRPNERIRLTNEFTFDHEWALLTKMSQILNVINNQMANIENTTPWRWEENTMKLYIGTENAHLNK